jgi:hypothetical protein
MRSVQDHEATEHAHAVEKESVHDTSARSREKNADSLRRKRLYDAQRKQLFAGQSNDRSKRSEPASVLPKRGRPRSTPASAVRNTTVGPASLQALSFDTRYEGSVASDSRTSASGMT